MFSFKAEIEFDRKSEQVLYLQLSSQIIELIKGQILPPKTKLPSSRVLATQLGVHRKTIVACYEELTLQGWIESIPKKGTYVLENLPRLIHRSKNRQTFSIQKENSSFEFITNEHLADKSSITKDNQFLFLRDGIPDVRLAPIDDLARSYRRICSRKSIFEHLSYGSTYGSEIFREVLSHYLNSTRGLHSCTDSILITRGSQMGIWLSAQLLLKSGDAIIVGKTNYSSANASFLSRNAKLIKVNVDDDGIDTEEIEELCKKNKIKAVYVTSHHHHPTTVILSAKRRIHLLNLANRYNFAILEDDYDYDFSYNRAPILPLASHDQNGNVIYIGSFCKPIAPVYRVGYLIGPRSFVKEASKLRGIIDRQGDALLELTFAEFIKSGDLDRHLRKVSRIYKQRRDLFCDLLQKELGKYVSFNIPIGGMAVWLALHKKYSWTLIGESGRKHKLIFTKELFFDSIDTQYSYLRLGFAEYNEEEICEMIDRLRSMFRELEGND